MRITIEDDFYGTHVIEDAIAWKVWTEEDVRAKAEEENIVLTEEELGFACLDCAGTLGDCTDDDWEIIARAIYYAKGDGNRG